MTELFVDIETYSTEDIKKTNVYRYTKDPEFMILMAAWAIDDGPVQIAIEFGEIYAIPGLWDSEVMKVAHNAPFERICFSWMGRKQYECEPDGFLPPEHWDDTMILASEWGYPASLENLAKALGTTQKSSAGTRLISLFCKPNKQGKRNLPEDFPEEWEEFKAYCIQDVETLREIKRLLPDWPTENERLGWLADQRVNDRGIKVDLNMARVAETAGAVNGRAATEEVIKLTGIKNPNSPIQMQNWLKAQGVQIENMQAATIEELLLDPDLKPDVRRVLELRQDIALIAAKKFTAALAHVSESERLRGGLRYFGAHTGRWTGSGVQLQNLPSATLGEKDDPPEAVERAIANGVVDLLMGEPVDPHTLKALVRAMFLGPFTVVDYAAIEARVIAWLAGEEWALQAFRDGRDIYVETAERMGGLTRKEGKVAVLALGYAGGIKALRRMGAQGDDEALKFLRDQWREASPAIVDFWKELGDAFRFGDRPAGKHIYVEKQADNRLIRLPSGRALVYRKLRGKWVLDQWDNKRFQITFLAPSGIRTYTYGGKLAENVTQAVARDILNEALIRIDQTNLRPVLHVHDEIVVEGASIDELKKIMVQTPTWAKGLPISAAGFQCARYRKD